MRKKVLYTFGGVVLLGLSVGISTVIANGKMQVPYSSSEPKEQNDSLVFWDYGKEAITISVHERIVLSNNFWSHAQGGKMYVYCCDTKETTEICVDNDKEYLCLPQGTYKLYCLQGDGNRMDLSAYVSVETWYDGTENRGVIPIC